MLEDFREINEICKAVSGLEKVYRMLKYDAETGRAFNDLGEGHGSRSEVKFIDSVEYSNELRISKSFGSE